MNDKQQETDGIKGRLQRERRRTLKGVASAADTRAEDLKKQRIDKTIDLAKEALAAIEKKMPEIIEKYDNDMQQIETAAAVQNSRQQKQGRSKYEEILMLYAAEQEERLLEAALQTAARDPQRARGDSGRNT